jgi:hypothetical protein
LRRRLETTQHLLKASSDSERKIFAARGRRHLDSNWYSILIEAGSHRAAGESRHILGDRIVHHQIAERNLGAEVLNNIRLSG